jgi:hypothetical protein
MEDGCTGTLHAASLNMTISLTIQWSPMSRPLVMRQLELV